MSTEISSVLWNCVLITVIKAYFNRVLKISLITVISFYGVENECRNNNFDVVLTIYGDIICRLKLVQFYGIVF